MRISVIIPSYNRAPVLGRAVRSVFAQSWVAEGGEIEVILIDDGSTDSTSRLIEQEFSGVTYRYQENAGVSAARNAGLRLASSDWVALLDSDDEWLPHKLAQQTQLLDQTGLKVCHTEEIWIRNGVRVNQMHKHRKSGGWIFKQCLPLCAMSPSSIIIHRSVLDDVGWFDESLPACEDYDLWLRITAKHEVAFVEQPCINKYGGHDDQLSRQHWGMDRFRVRALEKILDQELPRDYQAAARETLIQKLQILKQGADKHQNQKLLADCEARLLRWAV